MINETIATFNVKCIFCFHFIFEGHLISIYEDDGHDDSPPMWICGVLDADGVWNKPGAPPQPVITAITYTHPSRCPVLGNTDPDRAQ